MLTFLLLHAVTLQLDFLEKKSCVRRYTLARNNYGIILLMKTEENKLLVETRFVNARYGHE